MLGLVLAVAMTAARSASATLVDFSGIFTEATASGDLLTFPANTTTINNGVSGDLTGATVNDLAITLGSTISELSLAYTDSSSGDTFDIMFPLTGVTVTTETFSFVGTTLYYGLISATIPAGEVMAVQETGTSDPSLTTTINGYLSDYTVNGGTFGLTYNGIHVAGDTATIAATPSASFTVIPNSDPTPEPSTIVLILTGAAALALQRLARQLRKTALTETDVPPTRDGEGPAHRSWKGGS